MFSKTHLLYERVSKSYYFQLVHDAEQPRRIQLHGSSLSVFPMGLHELAYGFPNSVLHTSGGGWNSVIEKPRLTGNRTVSTFLNDVKIPPHEFYVHPNGKVRITFTSVSPSDDLDAAVRAFAIEFAQRVSKLATLRFKSHNPTAPETNVTIVAKRIVTSSARHENTTASMTEKYTYSVVQFEELIESSLTKLNEGWVRDYLKNTLADEQLEAHYNMSDGNLPTEWLGALEELRKRLAEWTLWERERTTPAAAAGPAPMDWEDRNAAFFQGLVQAPAPAPPTPPPAPAPRENTHTFTMPFVPNDPNGTKGLDAEVQIVLTPFSKSRITAPTTVAIDPLVTFVAALVKTPEFVGSRVPMIQRLHLLLSDPDVIAILKDFVYKPNRSAQQRAVQPLIESRTIVYVMEPLIILSNLQKYFNTDVDDRKNPGQTVKVAALYNTTPLSLTKLETLLNVLTKGIENYPKLGFLKTQTETRKPTDPEWLRHGEMTFESPITIKIMVSAAKAPMGPTPASDVGYEVPLRVALCRLLYNPRDVSVTP